MLQSIKDKIDEYVEYKEILKYLKAVNELNLSEMPSEREKQVREYLDFSPKEGFFQKNRKGRVFEEYFEYKCRSYLREAENEDEHSR